MTKTVAENANRDMFLDGSGNLAFYSGVLAVEQLCKSRIEAQRGEMKYAADQGMPMFSTAFNQFNPKQFEAAARSILMATPDVTAVESFSMYVDDSNTLQYSAVIQTIYGSTTVSSQ